ncbi:hypothetical protein GCM10011410_02120 [Hoyosella rhizosphaerae]|uniref:Uncharacterized protein n=1 Tax=Hoyosella rhizosphaerae TaxID=1755582 RepID=A0A916X7Z2_9ACTN|nr:hypothetical protein GCM10011410_02120 [Hoyosella rhizosphaerae]
MDAQNLTGRIINIRGTTVRRGTKFSLTALWSSWLKIEKVLNAGDQETHEKAQFGAAHRGGDGCLRHDGCAAPIHRGRGRRR